MSKMSPRQQSIVHFALAVQQWRSSGWSDRSINTMLVCALEGMRSVHANVTADAILILEVADGKRVA